MTQPSIAFSQGAFVDVPTVRRIHVGDIGDALAEGVRDFRASPTHLIFLGLIYPVVGLLLGRIASGQNALPLIYPLLGGFALIGPFAAVGLYDLSRQREMGETVSWRNAFDVLRSPRIGAILLLGAALAVAFVVWLTVAHLLYAAIMPPGVSGSISDLFQAATTTPAGRHLIVVGTLVGFCFAAAVLVCTAVSFPLLVDREVAMTAGEQISVAVQTSIRTFSVNPIPMILWGLVVALGTALGMVTLFVGLAVVIPVLGHATWHLYRRVIA